MNYEGPLYGKIGKQTFDTGKTSLDWDKMQKVVDASRCIRHWHDSENGGMVVSAEHVRKLWESLAELDS